MTENNVNLPDISNEENNDKDNSPSLQEGPPSKTDNSPKSRMDSAKAFYRSMYAGADPPESVDFMQEKIPETSSKVCASCEHLQAEVTDLEKKLQDSQGLYKRMAADFENYRKRIEREREEYRSLGVQKAVEIILSAMDDFDRAKMMFTPSMDINKVIDNINIVHNSFIRSFESLGVKPLEAVGKPFDPRLHEPVQEIPTNDFPDNSVMHELRKGYQMNDKIIRPSLVNVAAKVEESSAKPSPTETAKDKVIQESALDEISKNISAESLEQNIDGPKEAAVKQEKTLENSDEETP